MKVLVADDHQASRKLLKIYLSSWGYEVILATDGNEAWDILTGPDPPLIAILDWMMPGKTGVEVCADCQNAGLSVYRLLLTAKEESEEMIYALDNGAHDFQSKPIVPGILRSRVSVGKRLMEAIQEVMRTERMAAVGSLVTGVAHHFNNLNLPILMYASSILKNTDVDPEIRKKVKKIEQASEQASELTENLMSIANNDNKKKELADLNELVTNTIEIDSISYGEMGITIERHLEPIPKVLINKTDIRHILMNLLKNACHALLTSTEKRIILKTGSKANYIYLNIQDTGCGIATNNLQKIFSPFYTEKGEFAKPGSPLNGVKGKGIGLYISKNIATNHDGKITVKSQLNRGSIFTLKLPAAD